MMNTPPKRHVSLAGAGKVQVVRSLELFWIAIGGAEQQIHAGLGCDWTAGDLRVLGGCAVGQLQRRIVAQKLFDRVRHELGSLAQQPHLLWMSQQRQHGVANQALGYTVADHEQEVHHGHRLARGEPVVWIRPLDHSGYHIVPWLGSAFLEQALETAHEEH